MATVWPGVDVNWVFGLVLIGLGCVTGGLCWPLRNRRVPRDGVYGFKFRQALASDAHWYRINEYGARRMLPWSGLILAVGAVLVAFAVVAPGAELLCWCGPYIPAVLLLPALQSWLFARSLGTQADASMT